MGKGLHEWLAVLKTSWSRKRRGEFESIVRLKEWRLDKCYPKRLAEHTCGKVSFMEILAVMQQRLCLSAAVNLFSNETSSAGRVYPTLYDSPSL
jgi:hypothetical protein